MATFGSIEAEKTIMLDYEFKTEDVIEQLKRYGRVAIPIDPKKPYAAAKKIRMFAERNGLKVTHHMASVIVKNTHSLWLFVSPADKPDEMDVPAVDDDDEL